MLVFWLPDAPGEGSALPWWEVGEGRILAHGTDSGWMARSVDRRDGAVERIALVGPASVRLDRRDAATLDSAQKKTAARLEAQDRALGKDAHAAVGADDEDGWVAIVDGAQMESWLGWGRHHEVALDRIVPIAALLPVDGKWHEAALGGRKILAKDGLALDENDPLAPAIVGEAFVDTIDRDWLMERIALLAAGPPVDLRQGRFARVQSWKPDPGRLREFALLLAAILLVAVAIPAVKAMRWNAAADELDRESAALATAALGRPVSAEDAESALRGTLGRGAAGSDAGQMVATLFAAMQGEPGVSADMISWDGAGALNARLVSSDGGAVNRILAVLQQRGWQVTANPLASGDGRAMVDISVRGIG